MTIVHITPRAAAVVSRIRGERRGLLTFTIDGGCCEGTAPHLFEDAVITPGAEKVGQVEGVAIYLQRAMVPMYADAEITIDVIDEPMSDALSLETAYGLRFVVREPATRSADPGAGTAAAEPQTGGCGLNRARESMGCDRSARDPLKST